MPTSGCPGYSLCLPITPSMIFPPGGRAAAGRDRHLDLLRIDRRIMRNMVFVGEQQLQRMFAERQRNLRFGLAGAKMQMIEITRDRLIERRQIGVDQQMMMT